jgi:hypothetical protein
MKTYRGYADASAGDGTALVTVTDEHGTRQLRPRVRHAPSGFAWGYAGPGPVDLAHSILADLLGHRPARSAYEQFHLDVIAKLPISEGWTITEPAIVD